MLSRARMLMQNDIYWPAEPADVADGTSAVFGRVEGEFAMENKPT